MSQGPEKLRLRFSDESQATFYLQRFQLARLLAFVTVVCVAGASTAADLQWRSPRGGSKKPSKPAIAQRFVQPRQQRRVDNAVRPAVFEEDGPQLAGASDGEAELRSVVVDGDESMQSARSAQLPESSADANAPNTGTGDQQQLDSEIQQQLRDPFGDAPPPLPGIDTPETPGLDATTTPQQPDDQTPPTDTEQPQLDRPSPTQTTPNLFQPSVPPTGETTQPLPDSVPAPSASTLAEEEEQTQEDCEDSLTKLRAKTISTVNLSIAVTGTEGQDFPFECSLDTGEWHAGRTWPQTTYLWKAAALCHKPLYFEDEQLERYGHSWPPCCQPFVSGAHFFTRLPILPYCMGVEPPNECIYALGHYRPGSCAPYMCNPVPLSPRGALFQAGAVVGAAAVLP
jgi:hypothetical protein